MKNFEVKIKFNGIDNDGKNKVMNTGILYINLINIPECANISEEYCSREFEEYDIKVIKESRISEVINKNNAEISYEVTVNFIDINERTGKEKKTSTVLLVFANDIDSAKELANEAFKSSIVPYTFSQIKESHIKYAFNYSENTPINETSM